MRSSKYHDYRVLKIALFIILVVLGLFIYIKCIRAPLEHTAPDNAWKVLTEATCTTDGERCKVCTECGKEFDHEAIPATGHNVSLTWTTKKEATCTEAGMRVKECKDCKKTFEQEVIPAKGHTLGTSRVENYVAPTCTEGGSKDIVNYCTTCGNVAKKETVQMDPTGHTAGEKKQENTQDSTHTVIGTYDLVTYCATCKVEIDTEEKFIEPKGHDYSSWEIKLNEDTDAYEMIGTCDCDESGNVIVLDADDGLTLTLDESVPVCQTKRYIATVTYEGTEITRMVEVDPEPHVIYVEDNDGVITYVTMDDCVKHNDKHGRYFDYSLPGMHLVVDTSRGETEENVWSEDGFAIAVFKCVRCSEWQAVLVYSPEYDATLPPKNDEE